MTKIRVLIADDQPLVRQGIEALLALEVDITVVGQASDGNEAVQKILSQTGCCVDGFENAGLRRGFCNKTSEGSSA